MVKRFVDFQKKENKFLVVIHHLQLQRFFFECCYYYDYLMKNQSFRIHQKQQLHLQKGPHRVLMIAVVVVSGVMQIFSLSQVEPLSTFSVLQRVLQVHEFQDHCTRAAAKCALLLHRARFFHFRHPDCTASACPSPKEKRATFRRFSASASQKAQARALAARLRRLRTLPSPCHGAFASTT